MNSRKLNVFRSIALAAFVAAPAFAGGLNTNTNQSAIFQRNVTRDASLEADAPYANPAGTAFMKDGFHISLNNQTFWQTRSTTVNNSPIIEEGREFKGESFVPSMPSVLATWHHGDLALFMHFGIIGGGGSVSFDDGIPSFEASVAQLPSKLTAAGLPTSAYKADISLDASSYIFGFTLGAAYRFADMFSLSLGARFNYAFNHYEGSLKNVQVNPTLADLGLDGDMVNAAATFNQLAQSFDEYAKKAAAGAEQAESAGAKEKAAELKATAETYAEKSATFDALATAVSDKELDVEQTGWGITPILGLGFHYKRLTIGAKLEYNTSIEMENDTKKNEVGLAAYDDGVKGNSDVPTYIAVGAQYALLDNVRLALGYHHWFDSKADLSGDLEDYVDDSNEFLYGVEVDFLKRFTISGGVQVTRFGIKDGYISDMNINLSSTTFGFGLAYRVTDWMRLNLGYFHTLYNDYDEIVEYGIDVYARESRGLGIGLDFDF